MGASRLRVVLAENGLTETGLTLRSVCAEAGQVLELVRVGKGADLVQALQDHRPDIALLKLTLLQPDAGDRLRVLQESSPSIPLILLAEPADKVNAETCLAMGAADYLVEGYLDERTMSRVLHSAIARTGAQDGTQAFPMEQSDWSSGWSNADEQKWVFTLAIEVAGDGPVWRGGETKGGLILEVADVLRKNVRSTDTVEIVSDCELAVTVRDLDKVKRAAVRNRIEASLRNHPLSSFGQRYLQLRASGTAEKSSEAGWQLAVGTIEERTAVEQRAQIC